MTPATIKEMLAIQGIQYKDLAAELGVTKGALSLVINGKSVSDRLQRAIALKLGYAPEDLFPEYYSRHTNKITKPEERENARGNP